MLLMTGIICLFVTGCGGAPPTPEADSSSSGADTSENAGLQEISSAHEAAEQEQGAGEKDTEGRPEAMPPSSGKDGTAKAGSSDNENADQIQNSTQKDEADNNGKKGTAANRTANDDPGAVKVVANPHEVTVLVNKVYRLPDNYRPADLVEPNVPFIFSEKSEKRLLRKEAAEALEALFAAAKADGVHLAGVSGFRSHDTQKWLFEHYVKTRGEAEARRFSAMPGHSEHQTGLAIDVSGSDGRCAAEDCFAGTKEAKWLAEHAHEHGFIIRYPQGKEDITGYKYEPWHLRYVGKELAQTLVQSGLTLDEYLQGTVPVSNESP